MYLKLLGYFLYFLLVSAAVFILLAAAAFFISCALEHEKPLYALKLLFGKAD
ncbi:MAG: hypothetical protein ACLUF9_00630 [Oscillospiraceae bacterium]